MIFQLIYTCALAKGVTPDDLRHIAKASAHSNAKRGVTGILLCQDGSVLQVLEGEQTVVERLYARIAQDPRISNALVLIRRNATAREFPKWSMGYRHTDETDCVFELCARSFPQALPQNPTAEVNTISRTFARVNGLARA